MKIYITEVKKRTQIKLDGHITRTFIETTDRFVWPELQKCLEWIKQYTDHDPDDGFHWRVIVESWESKQHLYTTNKVKNKYGHIENYDIWIKTDYIPG